MNKEREKIYKETMELLENEYACKKMTQAKNPYCDGLASERIVKILKGKLNSKVL